MRRTTWWLLVVVGVVAPLSVAAKRRAPAVDRVWVHSKIESLRPRRVAILPAVSFEFLPKERSYVEDAWEQRMIRSRHAWLPAVLCRERMAATSRQRDSLLTAVAAQIRNRGRVDSTSSPRLARLLNTDALLCLRIDRWERMGVARSTQIYVDMTASLVDSTGRLLWKVSSEERLESLYGVPKLEEGTPADAGRGQGSGAPPIEQPATPGSAPQAGEEPSYGRSI